MEEKFIKAVLTKESGETLEVDLNDYIILNGNNEDYGIDAYISGDDGSLVGMLLTFYSFLLKSNIDVAYNFLAPAAGMLGEAVDLLKEELEAEEAGETVTMEEILFDEEPNNVIPLFVKNDSEDAGEVVDDN